MKRHITIGPERVEATFGAFTAYMDELALQGVPDDAKVSFSTASDGVVLTNVDFDQEVDRIPQPKAKG